MEGSQNSAPACSRRPRRIPYHHQVGRARPDLPAHVLTADLPKIRDDGAGGRPRQDRDPEATHRHVSLSSANVECEASPSTTPGRHFYSAFTQLMPNGPAPARERQTPSALIPAVTVRLSVGQTARSGCPRDPRSVPDF